MLDVVQSIVLIFIILWIGTVNKVRNTYILRMSARLNALQSRYNKLQHRVYKLEVNGEES